MLYVPARDRCGNEVASYMRWLDEAVIIFCSIAGGVTITASEGAWMTADGAIIKEPVQVLHASVEAQHFAKHQAVLLDFMQRFGHATNQEAVAAEYEGRMIFVRIQREPISIPAQAA